MTPEEVVERAYAVFAPYPFPDDPGFCPTCYPDGYPELAAPPREIDGEDVAEYVSDAMWCLGGPDVFRHLAPRVLADVVDGRVPREAGLYLWRFVQAGLAEWPAAERRVVQDAVRLVAEHRLSHPPDLYSNRTMAAVAMVHEDVPGLLAAWAVRTDPEAVGNLAAVVVADPASTGHLSFAEWWHHRPDVGAAVVGWLREPGRLDQLRAAGGYDALRADAIRLLGG